MDQVKLTERGTRTKDANHRSNFNQHRIFVDLTGAKANHAGGHQFALVLHDKQSKSVWMYPLQHREEWISKVVWWKHMIEDQCPPQKIVIFRTDSHLATNSIVWDTWIANEGINLKYVSSTPGFDFHPQDVI